MNVRQTQSIGIQMPTKTSHVIDRESGHCPDGSRGRNVRQKDL
uniref:Uncharacterized protein n=1 Tax=Faecalibaculum rodentium TaxID=1702221 RepID=A0A140DTM8_9FIRM|nr:hypothetical protein AALO17_08710 [Faecalibaculum rodentium]